MRKKTLASGGFNIQLVRNKVNTRCEEEKCDVVISTGLTFRFNQSVGYHIKGQFMKHYKRHHPEIGPYERSEKSDEIRERYYAFEMAGMR